MGVRVWVFEFHGMSFSCLVCVGGVFSHVTFFADDVRLPISVEDFEGHVKKMHANTDHLFSEEYEVIGHMTITWESHALSWILTYL